MKSIDSYLLVKHIDETNTSAKQILFSQSSRPCGNNNKFTSIFGFHPLSILKTTVCLEMFRSVRKSSRAFVYPKWFISAELLSQFRSAFPFRFRFVLYYVEYYRISRAMKLTHCLLKATQRSGKGRQYTTAHLLRFPLLMAGILITFSIGFRYRWCNSNILIGRSTCIWYLCHDRTILCLFLAVFYDALIGNIIDRWAYQNRTHQ